MAGDEQSLVRKRVYLDVCSLNRPLDDQNQLRIRMEADAVQLILSHVRAGDVNLVVSPAHHVEVAANPDTSRREHVQILLRELGTEISVDLIKARLRATALIRGGVKPADAAHAALAEMADCAFVTVDDRLLRRLHHTDLGVWFGTPGAYCEKEDL